MKEIFVAYLYPSLWLIVLSISISLYGILDGFDLGVGVLYLFPKKDDYRRQLLNAIGPVWDGNEVWLIVIFGGLFAGFPSVYANLLSLFYLPIWYLVFFLIFRVISIEFRSKSESQLWRGIWDIVFSLSSIMIIVFLGGFLGNIIAGFPIDFSKEMIKEKVSYINFYSVLIGIFSVSLALLHGIIYAIIKVSEDFLLYLKKLILKIAFIFFGLYVFTFLYTLLTNSYIKKRMINCPLSWLLIVLSLFSLFMIMLYIKKEKFIMAFLYSSLNIFWLISNTFVLLFPNILRSSLDETKSLTIINASSGESTLKVLLMIVVIGLPFVLGYMFYIYRTFRGKVKISSSGY